MVRALVAALLALAFAAACGGGSEDTGTGSTSPTPKATATRSQARSPTPTALSAAETPAVTEAPAQPTQPPQEVITPVPTEPPPAPTAPPANSAPSFPDPLSITTDTSYEYDDDGYLTGVVTIITIPAAGDPDGDPLTYSWSASNGSISGGGLTATWTRSVDFGEPQPGTVTVTVSDGRGGSDSIQIEL